MAAITNGRQTGLYTYESFSGTVAKEKDRHFLWWCAGTHQPLLKECPSEHSKYAGLGGVVLATFALAALSSGYAVYSVFDNSAWAVLFALLWGLIIFNFDRFLVSSMRKYGVSRSKQLWMAFPRIVLALIIGVTIARPLELKIFEKEIDVKVAENRQKEMQLNDSLLQIQDVAVLQTANNERSRLLARKSQIEDTLHRLQQDYVREADGTGGSLQRGVDQLTLLKQHAYEIATLQYAPELSQLTSGIHYQDSLLNTAKASHEIKRAAYREQLNAKTGFLERNKALSDLSSQESSVFIASLLVSLLIILIEIGPALSKLIMTVGPYDVGLARIELMQMAEAESTLSNQYSTLNTQVNSQHTRNTQ